MLVPPGTGFRADGTTWLRPAQYYVFLGQDSELRFFWSTQDPRPLIVQEFVIQPNTTLRLQEFLAQQRAALKYAMIKFPEFVCEKAYEELQPRQNCVIEQVSAVLGVRKTV